MRTELTRRIGITVPLTTVDQPVDHMLRNGGLPELHRTASFGSRPLERLATLREHQPTGPLMCAGASVNIYMFHGGTNFGFTNGANHKGTYQPIVTSYDYDAPLDEAGRPTAKYWAFREVIGRHAELPPAPPAVPAVPAPQVETTFTRAVALWDVLDLLGEPATYPHLPTTDDLEHYIGFTLYTPHLPPARGGVPAVAEVRDRAQVFVDRRSHGVLSRDHGERMIGIRADEDAVVDLLVEDLGRVNYGPRIGEPKGLIGPATYDGAAIDTWTVRPVRLDDIDAVVRRLRDGDFVDGPLSGPVFTLGGFAVPDPGRDLFLDTSSWGKGVAWINGFCLGQVPLLRYERDMIGAEARYLRLVAARASGVPVPSLLHHGRHPELGDWLLTARLPGRTLQELTRVGADVGPLRAEVGRVLAALHAVTGDRYGYDGGRTGAPTWRGAFTAMMDDLLADAADWAVSLPAPAPRIRELVARHGAALDVVRRPALLHFDGWAGNVLAAEDPDGTFRLSGLVDGERHLWGDPLLDLVSPLLFRRVEDEPDDPLVRAYRTLMPFPLDAGARRRLGLYRLHLYLLMTVEMPSRGITARSDPGRVALLAELLDAELTALTGPAA